MADKIKSALDSIHSERTLQRELAGTVRKAADSQDAFADELAAARGETAEERARLKAEGAVAARELACVESQLAAVRSELERARLEATAARDLTIVANSKLAAAEERGDLLKKELLAQRLNHLPLFGTTYA